MTNTEVKNLFEKLTDKAKQLNDKPDVALEELVGLDPDELVDLGHMLCEYYSMIPIAPLLIAILASFIMGALLAQERHNRTIN